MISVRASKRKYPRLHALNKRKREEAKHDKLTQEVNASLTPYAPANPVSQQAVVGNISAFSKNVRQFLSTVHMDDPDRRTKLQILIERLFSEDPKLLLAYAFGKPMERVELVDVENRASALAVPHTWSVEEIRNVLITIREIKTVALKRANVTDITGRNDGGPAGYAGEVAGTTAAGG